MYMDFNRYGYATIGQMLDNVGQLIRARDMGAYIWRICRASGNIEKWDYKAKKWTEAEQSASPSQGED